MTNYGFNIIDEKKISKIQFLLYHIKVYTVNVAIVNNRLEKFNVTH